MERRHFLQLLVSTAIASHLSPPAVADESPLTTPPGESSQSPLPWRNWSGSQKCLPSNRVAPATIEELRHLLQSLTTLGLPYAPPLGPGTRSRPWYPLTVFWSRWRA